MTPVNQKFLDKLFFILKFHNQEIGFVEAVHNQAEEIPEKVTRLRQMFPDGFIKALYGDLHSYLLAK